MIQLQESFAIMSHRVAPGDEDSFSSSTEDENSEFEDTDSSELEIIEKSESSLVNFEGSSATDLSFSESEEDDSETSGQSYLFLLMEYCSNRTLKDEIYLTGEGGLSVDRAWSLIRDTLEGLKYIHGLKTIHRDLKPGNIFLDSQDRAKIGDFGLATQMEIRIKLDEVKGSEGVSGRFLEIF